MHSREWTRGTRCRSWSGLAVGICLFAAVSGATGNLWSDDDVKAAFLLRFTSYVTWPGEAQANMPVEIAVLGAPQTASKLREAVEARNGANRAVGIRSITRLEDARGASVLFVGGERRVEPGALAVLARGRGLLVVTDSQRGLAAGGAINFLTVDRRVRFEVSLEAARRADVHISSELLAVATRVQGNRPRSP
jgi:hypothetical protein